jgi:hypothetical protein
VYISIDVPRISNVSPENYKYFVNSEKTGSGFRRPPPLDVFIISLIDRLHTIIVM